MENSLQDLSTYISFVLGLCYDYATPTLMSMLHPHILLLIYLKAIMPHTCALMSYSLISIVHVYTIYTLCGTLVP